MSTLRKSYSVGDVSNENNVVNRRQVRGGGAVLQELDETDRIRNQVHLQTAPQSIGLDDSDTEEFDDLYDDMVEIENEQAEGIHKVSNYVMSFLIILPFE